MTGPSKNQQEGSNAPAPDVHRDVMQPIREQRQLARMPRIGNDNTRPATESMDRQTVLYALGFCSNEEAANEAYAAFRRLCPPPQKG